MEGSAGRLGEEGRQGGSKDNGRRPLQGAEAAHPEQRQPGGGGRNVTVCPGSIGRALQPPQPLLRPGQPSGPPQSTTKG